MKRFWLIVPIVLMVAVLGFSRQHVLAQTGNSRYFPETGHWVTGGFLKLYESIPNPTLLFGAPITEAFEDSSNTKVQYFEKVRFELDPSLPTNIQVKISPLGEYIYGDNGGQGSTNRSPACRYFAESGFSVCYAFREFFESNGGINQFGYPISESEKNGRYIVQYFQKARLEWHPENTQGKWVTVGNLGLRYFHLNGEDPKLLSPILEGENIPARAVLRLRTKAFINSSVLPSGGEQTIYVIVKDQNFKSVPGAEVEFVVTYPDGRSKEYRTSDTNSDGVSKLTFPVGSRSFGMANVKVFAYYNDLEGQTRTSFHIWR